MSDQCKCGHPWHYHDGAAFDPERGKCREPGCECQRFEAPKACKHGIMEQWCEICTPNAKIAEAAANDVQAQYPRVDYLFHTVRAAVLKAMAGQHAKTAQDAINELARMYANADQCPPEVVAEIKHLREWLKAEETKE